MPLRVGKVSANVARGAANNHNMLLIKYLRVFDFRWRNPRSRSGWLRGLRPSSLRFCAAISRDEQRFRHSSASRSAVAFRSAPGTKRRLEIMARGIAAGLSYNQRRIFLLA